MVVLYTAQLVECWIFGEFLPVRMRAQQFFTIVCFTVVVYRTCSSELTFSFFSKVSFTVIVYRTYNGIQSSWFFFKNFCLSGCAHSNCFQKSALLSLYTEHEVVSWLFGEFLPVRMRAQDLGHTHMTRHSSWRSTWGGREKMEGLGHRGVLICISTQIYLQNTPQPLWWSMWVGRNKNWGGVVYTWLGHRVVALCIYTKGTGPPWCGVGRVGYQGVV